MQNGDMLKPPQNATERVTQGLNEPDERNFPFSFGNLSTTDSNLP